MKEYRILLVGGGTGGHVYPLIGVAQALGEKTAAGNINLKLMAVGEGKFMEKACQANQLIFKKIAAGKLRRYFSLSNFLDIFPMLLGTIQSFWRLYWFMPDAVFAKGGYASLIPSLVARVYFIPLFIHESDSVPGLTNKILGRLAKKIFISFENAREYFNPAKTVLTGNPVRKNIFDLDRNAAIQFFNLSPERKTIFIFGGSQGAKKINDVILDSLAMMTGRYQIIHQCGESQYEEVKMESDRLIQEGGVTYGLRIKEHYHLFPFLEEEAFGMAYAAADVIISRAGAEALFEIAHLGKPAIIIPLTESASNHQFLNALEFQRSGVVVIEEQNLTRDILIQQVGFLMDPLKYSEVSQRIKSFVGANAADKIADELLAFAVS